MATITVCSSADFYRKAIEVQKELETQGLFVIIPATAEKMKKSGDYDVSHYKTWFSDANDYSKKTELMNGHFAEVEKGDAILVINEEKRGVPNYIGGNVLMEMTVAYYLKKPIFILNDVPQESAYLEEIIGLNPIVLNGNLDGLVKKYIP